jgi:hypothetical protein
MEAVVDKSIFVNGKDKFVAIYARVLTITDIYLQHGNDTI